jgi:hypothetical protein
MKWKPGIGDPGFMGWFTVAAYMIAGLLSAFVALHSYRLFGVPDFQKQKRLWAMLAILLFFLGINKQLDLQSLFTDIGRAISVSQGWYGERRTYQFWFVLALTFAGFVSLFLVGWFIRRSLKQNGLVLFGLTFLLTFILVRAASFHHFDEVLHWRPMGIRMNWILELTGIFCIGIAAISKIHKGVRPPKYP